MISVVLLFKLRLKESLPKPATIERALARPTLSVVLGSLLGGSGAGDRPKKTNHN